jgi:hypothetical protein
MYINHKKDEIRDNTNEQENPENSADLAKDLDNRAKQSSSIKLLNLKLPVET